MELVRINKLSELTGLTEEAIRQLVKKGDWLKGKHWEKAPNGRLWFNTTEIQAWVRGKGV